MCPFDIRFDLSDLARACSEADDVLRRAPAVAARKAAQEGLAEAKAKRRYKDRSGNLTGKATVKAVSLSGAEATFEIHWDVPYADYVDAGTKAHTIYAKLGGGVAGPLRPGQSRGGSGKGLLTFQIGGRWVSTPSVKHPGSRATGFAGDAARKAEDVLLREMEVAISDAQKILDR